MDVKNIHNVNLSRRNKNSINIAYDQPNETKNEPVLVRFL